jgi:hypothetical protein
VIVRIGGWLALALLVFVIRGFSPLPEMDILTIVGTIRNLQAKVFGGVPTIQLFAHEAGAEMPLGGTSGAPVLVGSGAERLAIGLLRWNPTRPDNPALSLGGTLFACPLGAVIERRPELREYLLQRVCFVIMGFGKKTNYETGRVLDLNASYENLIKPAVEAAGLKWILTFFSASRWRLTRASLIRLKNVSSMPLCTHRCAVREVPQKK